VAKVLDEKYETAAQSILDFRLKEFNPKSKIQNLKLAQCVSGAGSTLRLSQQCNAYYLSIFDLKSGI
jgi:hypothetical protein